MGVVSSLCKPKKPDKHTNFIHDDFIKTINASPSSSSDNTQCSAISREPTNTVSYGYHYYLPSNQPIREYPDFPLFSTPFFLPFNGRSNMSYHRSNPYFAQAYNDIDVTATSPIFMNTDRSRTIPTSMTDLSPETSTSDIIQTTNKKHRIGSNQMLTHVDTSVTTDKNEQLNEAANDNESHLVKRSISAPIDMFLIDMSNEHVPVGQPVSINIRHLLLDTLENHHTTSSTPVRIEPASITTYAHENLLNYIPYVCEKYPNNTINTDQITRNTLHFRMPSQFSRSLNSLA